MNDDGYISRQVNMSQKAQTKVQDRIKKPENNNMHLEPE